MVRPFYEFVKLRDDVLDESLDDKMAPDLGYVYLGKEHEIYVNPRLFFERTLMTKSMLDILRNVAEALSGKMPSKLVLLNSLFGGGKTHTMLTIYHAVRSPQMLDLVSLENESLKEDLELVKERLLEAGEVKTIVIDGHISQTVPSPLEPLSSGPFRIQTLWGYIAFALGKYDNFKKYDETLVPPPVDELVELFKGQKLLILIDEIANHISRLKKSSDETIKNYAEQVITFMENFAKAIESTRGGVVAIVSLPRSEEHVEPRYKDVVYEVSRALERIALSYTPVAAEDFPKILKVRLFKEIDKEYPKKLAKEYLDAYLKEGEITSNPSFVISNIENLFPFHPDFIDTIKTIIESHGHLQKTRDAIRLARIVVRNLIRNREQTSLVMPYHLDPEDNRIKGILFIKEFEPFAQVVDEDISKRSREYEEPELASRIAKYILLKTFTISKYAVHGNLTLLPSKKDVIRATYELLSNEKYSWSAPDYSKALEWLFENAGYLYEREGHYWFDKLKDVNRLLEEAAEGISGEEAEDALLRLLEEIHSLTKEEAVTRKKRKSRKEGILFRNNISVLEKIEPLEVDEPEYRLLILPQSLRKDDLWELIYIKARGQERRYANTIYVTFTNSVEKLSEALDSMKMNLACEKLKMKLKEYLPNLSKDEMKIIEDKLKEKCRRVYENTITHIYTMFDSVAYPGFDDEQNMRTVKVGKLANPMYSIVETVERKLASEGKLYSKVYSVPVDFEVLESFIGSLVGKSVAEIEEYFVTNPKLPAVPKEEIREAIREAVNEKEIAIEKANGKVQLNVPIVERICEGNVCNEKQVTSHLPSSVDPSDKIINIVEAFKIFVKGMNPFGDNMIEEKSLPRGDSIEIIKYYVESIEGDRYELSELLEDEDLLEDQIKDIKIIRERVTVKRDVLVEIKPREVQAKPSEEVILEVMLQSVGDVKGPVILEVDYGELDATTVTFEEGERAKKVHWKITVPKMPNTYEYSLKASYEGRVKEFRVRISVVEEKSLKEGVPDKAQYLVLESNYLKHLDIIRKKLGNEWKIDKFSISARKGDVRINSEIYNPSWDQVINFIRFIMKSMSNPEYHYTLKLSSDEERPLPFSEEEKEVLKGVLRYR